MPLRNLLILISFLVCSLVCYGKAPHNRYLPMIDRAMQLVGQYYVDDVSERQLFEKHEKLMSLQIANYEYLDFN